MASSRLAEDRNDVLISVQSTILQNGQPSTSSQSGWGMRPSNYEIWKLDIFVKVEKSSSRCQNDTVTRRERAPIMPLATGQPTHSPWTVYQIIWRYDKHDTRGRSRAQPANISYEFFGPPGVLFVSTSVPFFTYVLSLQCSEQAGGCPPSWVELPTEFKMAVTDPDWWKSLWDAEASLVYFGWYAFCLVAWTILPGD